MSTVPASPGFELRGERGPLGDMLRNLWGSRDLLRILGKKDFQANYRRASFGLLWAIGLPLVEGIVLAVVFTFLRVRPGEGRNLPTFIFAGILPWSFFMGTLSSSVNAIVGGASLSTRIYFPRALLPLINVRSHLYGFLPAVGVLVAMSLVFGVDPGLHTLYLLPGIAHLVLLTSSFSLVVAALQVYYRDIRWIVQAVTRPWFYASGIFFPLSLAPDRLRPFLKVNPAVGLIQLFREGTVGADPGWEVAVWWSIAWAVSALGLATVLYHRYDRIFPDRL